MKAYQGQSPDDPTIGNHRWLKTHDFGHESWNFKPYRGKLYGYIPGSRHELNLTRLGALRSDKVITGVDVVWIARNPRNRTTYIVGWYRAATVYRWSGEFSISRAQGIDVQYQIVADPKNSHLLAPDQRLVRVPTEKATGNLGQSPVWYGGTDEFRRQVSEYLAQYGRTPVAAKRQTSGSPRQTDPEARKLIELAAIRHATTYYRSAAGGRRTVVSVEGDRVGWDLTVTAGNEVLKVEVKGLSGTDLCVDLTPNEYAQMHSPAHRSMYVIYVVTEAGTKNERSHIFYYNSEASSGRNHVWISTDGRKLNIAKVIGARLTANTPSKTI